MKKLFMVLAVSALVFASYSCGCNREKTECEVTAEECCPEMVDSTAVDTLVVE